jgi:hypothetical protein
MNISSNPSFHSPQVTSTSSIDHTKQMVALGITERLVLLSKTIFQSFLNLFFNSIDKSQLQRQWKEIYQGQKDVNLFPLTQNTSEMQSELDIFCSLYLDQLQDSLEASGNELQSLPESIGNLVNLKDLSLFDNQLQTLPESIGNLVNLRKLWLDNNQLQSLPASIGNLVNLKDLSLFGNQLQTLPESIGNLVNLTKLELDNNQLQTLPESIGNLAKLSYLRLSNNHFSSVPECLFRLSNNCEIDLKGNPLSEEEIARVRQRINQPGYRGPRFIF